MRPHGPPNPPSAGSERRLGSSARSWVCWSRPPGRRARAAQDTEEPKAAKTENRDRPAGGRHRSRRTTSRCWRPSPPTPPSRRRLRPTTPPFTRSGSSGRSPAASWSGAVAAICGGAALYHSLNGGDVRPCNQGLPRLLRTRGARTMTRASRFAGARAVAAAALLAVGCNTYHYYDVTIKLDTSSTPAREGGLPAVLPGAGIGSGQRAPQAADVERRRDGRLPDRAELPGHGDVRVRDLRRLRQADVQLRGIRHDRRSTATNFQCASGSVDFTASSTITQAMDMTVTGGPNECVSQTQQ